MVSVPTLKSLSSVNLAVQICLDHFKMEVANNFSGERQITSWKYLSYYEREVGTAKGNWEATIDDMNLPKPLQHGVAYHVVPVARRVYQWMLYQKLSIDLDPKYCVTFLKASLFTSKGKIDNRRAVEEMANDESLDLLLRFKIACVYMLRTQVEQLWKQMSADQRRSLNGANVLAKGGTHQMAQAVKLWTSFLENKLGPSSSNHALLNEDLTSETYFWRLALDMSIRYVNSTAFQICYESYHQHTDSSALASAFQVLDTLKRYTLLQGHGLYPDTFVDIVSFLMPMMTNNQQEAFFRQDATGSFGASTLLKCLLDSRCEPDVLHFTKYMWGILSETSFGFCLSNMCDRLVLREFWNQSPQRYKSLLTSNKKEIELVAQRNPCVLGLIVADMTLEEKRALMFSTESGKGVFLQMLLFEEYDSALWLVSSSDLTDEDWQIKLKGELELFLNDGTTYSIMFSERNISLEAFDKVLQLCLQSEKERELFKKRFAGGRLTDGYDTISFKLSRFEQYVHWCFSSSLEEIPNYKKVFVVHHLMHMHLLLVLSGKMQQLDLLLVWLGLSQTEIRNHKVNALIYLIKKFMTVHPMALFRLASSFQRRYGTVVTNTDDVEYAMEQIVAWHLADKKHARKFQKKLSIKTMIHLRRSSWESKIIKSAIKKRLHELS